MELDWETANSFKQIVLTCQPFEPCKRLSSHTAHEAESCCSTVHNIGWYVNSLWWIQRANWPLCPHVSFSLCGRGYLIVFTSHKLISFFIERTVSLDKESFTHVVLHPLKKVPPFTHKNQIGYTSGDKMRFPSYIDITCCRRALSSSLVETSVDCFSNKRRQSIESRISPFVKSRCLIRSVINLWLVQPKSTKVSIRLTSRIYKWWNLWFKE